MIEELAAMLPASRELGLKGSGMLAASVTGRGASPVLAGKAQFNGVGATIAGLPLADFAGTVSFDERRVDLPDLRGRFADGALRMDLAVKEWARAPDVQLEASLDRFDLGRYLEAKRRYQEQAAAAKPAAKPGRPAPPVPPKPANARSRGRLELGELAHPNAAVRELRVSWDLSGLGGPDLRPLSGAARLDTGGGRVKNVGELATQSPVVKVLVLPLLVVQKIGRLGGVRLFPDFNDIELRRISGDYLIREGVMTVRESHMDSDAAQVSATGSVDLPREALDLVVTAQVANVAPIDVAVTGTVAEPKTSVKLGKFIAEPAKQLIEGLLRR